MPLEQFLVSVMGSSEFLRNQKARATVSSPVPEFARHNGAYYQTPGDLQVEIKGGPSRILMIGGCLFDEWSSALTTRVPGLGIDVLHLAMHPRVPPPHDWAEYRFQIGQVPLRFFLSDAMWIDWLKHGYADPERAARLADQAIAGLERQVRSLCSWSGRVPVFLLNYLTPMQNINGRLVKSDPRADDVCLIAKLNDSLLKIAKTIPNVYVLDFDLSASVFGRRFFQEDSVVIQNHGGLISGYGFEEDQERIVKPQMLDDHYDLDKSEFIHSVYLQCDAGYRSLRGIGAVKMVCVDLDDTLWRGVQGEAEHRDAATATEGWPLGMIEALAALKRRGILLCLISKNTEDTVSKIWAELYGDSKHFYLSDFAIKKINWKSKVDNMTEALKEANILPNAVVFLDDNPVERAMMKSAYPDIRVIEAPHYYWKRILTWSAETQGSAITRESVEKTEMVQAQLKREEARGVQSRGEFLANLQLRAKFAQIRSRADARFARVVELVNKTNQFNTTGRRWTPEELAAACRDGLVMTAEASDRFSRYGLVAIAIVLGDVVEQVVMSCRVLGMDLELAFISHVTKAALRGRSGIRATTIDTKANLLSRDLFARCGWSRADGVWRATSENASPAHISVEVEA
jgi:FkbH-like protein